MLYSLVIDGVPGYPGPLPGRIRMPDGSTRTDLATWTDTELATIGYYPVTEVRPEFDPATQRLAGPVMALSGEVVVATWTAEPIPASPPSTVLTPLAFRLRLTQAERIAIEACIDPASTDANRYAVRDIEKLWAAAEFIDLADTNTVSAVEALEGFGLIAGGRAAEILAP